MRLKHVDVLFTQKPVLPALMYNLEVQHLARRGRFTMSCSALSRLIPGKAILLNHDLSIPFPFYHRMREGITKALSDELCTKEPCQSSVPRLSLNIEGELTYVH